MINVPGWGRQLLDDDFHILDPQHQVFLLFDDIVPNRLDICQNVYTTGVWGIKFYILKVRKF